MFSRYDVYTTVQSIYCYPDTDVLKNRLNIHDRDELKQAEEEFSAVQQALIGRDFTTKKSSKTPETHGFRGFLVYQNASQSLPPAGGKEIKSFSLATCA